MAEKSYLAGRVVVTTGDITSLAVDAIVNAANAALMGGGGVDGHIHERGGRAVTAACSELRRTPLPRRVAGGRGSADDGRQSARTVRGPHGGSRSGVRTNPPPSCSRRAIAGRSSWPMPKGCSRFRFRPSRPAHTAIPRTAQPQWPRRRSRKRWTRPIRSAKCTWSSSATPTAIRSSSTSNSHTWVRLQHRQRSSDGSLADSNNVTKPS